MNWRNHKGLTFTLAVALALGAWWLISYLRDPNGSEINDMRWQESVKLASGETIQVKRHVRFRQQYSIGVGQMTAPRYQTASLEIVPAPKDFVPWSAPMIPIFLDRDPDNGEWIVVGAEGNSSMWDFNGKPCPPQWGFRLHQGVWYIQPVPANLIGRPPNLLVELHVSDDADYSPESFVPVAVDRMKQQTAIGNNIALSMKSIGVVATKKVQCDTPGPPRFTDKFMPERTEGPTLAIFPRMP
jgi:hypothetical protein